jgi:hypothetical protein
LARAGGAGDNFAMQKRHDHRRESPRIGIEALCWELVDGRETSGLAVDLSSVGLRIERPYTGGPTRKDVPLQIELPGLDEIMWARADACFDVLVPSSGPAGGAARDPRNTMEPGGRMKYVPLVRRTGYRIVAAASRDLRRLEELVIETDRLRRPDRSIDFDQLGLASCYRA